MAIVHTSSELHICEICGRWRQLPHDDEPALGIVRYEKSLLKWLCDACWWDHVPDSPPHDRGLVSPLPPPLRLNRQL